MKYIAAAYVAFLMWDLFFGRALAITSLFSL